MRKDGALRSDRQRIVAALSALGLLPEPASVCGEGCGITFRFADPYTAGKTLRDKAIFAEGPLGILHSRMVGGLLTEYRSYTGARRYSLHIVIGKERVFAHLDRYNAYQSLIQLILHGVLELVPHLFRTAFGRKTRPSSEISPIPDGAD